MLRTLQNDEVLLVAGGNYDVQLGDDVFAGYDLTTTVGMSVTDNGDDTFDITMVLAGGEPVYDDGTFMALVGGGDSLDIMGQTTTTRTVTRTVTRNSGSSTVSATGSFNLTIGGKGFSASGSASRTSPSTSSVTTVTTTRTTTGTGSGGVIPRSRTPTRIK